MWRNVNCGNLVLKIVRFSHSFKRKMAATDVLERLESKAACAEEMIAELKNQVAELKQLQVQYVSNVQMHQLEEENLKLKLEIEEWKKRLISLETAAGIKQVTVGARSSPGFIVVRSPAKCAIYQMALQRAYDSRSSQVPLPNQNPSDTAELPSGDPATDFNALFPKHQAIQKALSHTPPAPSEDKTSPSPTTEDKTSAPSDGGKKKKEKPQVAAPKKGSGVGEEPPVDVGRLDLRVGRIVNVKKHPDADSLYVEEVDVGEEKPRTVVSGLVKFVPLEQMQDRMVVLLCNLKPAKMRGVTSEAMVMCASTPDKVEILIPPAGSVAGDQVHVEGYPRVPDSVLNPKKKVFETVAPDLKTNQEKVATYKGSVFNVPGKGVVTAPSLVGVNIK